MDFDLLKDVFEFLIQLVLGVAAVIGVRFARRVRRHNQLTEHREDDSGWSPKVVTGINNYLRLRIDGSEPDGFDLDICQRPDRNPRIQGPYYSVSGAELNALARRAESLASYDIAQPHIIDALIEGLGPLGLGQLARNHTRLLEHTLLGSLGGGSERHSTDLVTAASVPPSERDHYRFALLVHEPFIVWVYLIDDKAGRWKT